MEKEGRLKAEPRYKCVVVGASAGGVEALTSFFHNLPPTPNLIYVVALHISSKYPSALTDIIGRIANMPTHSLQDKQKLEPNHIYIIPPGVDIELRDSQIHFIKTQSDNRPHPDISKLFESFAQFYGPRMIAIVLSGTGSDGSGGARVVRNFGGTVLAQNTSSSKYTSMPESARNTGAVDMALDPAGLAEKIVQLSSLTSSEIETDNDPTIGRILNLVRLSKGLDFSLYKIGTVRRRIQYRMQQTGLTTMAEYLNLIRAQASEVDQLFNALLISVTEFFRDREAFFKLRETLQDAIKESKGSSQFRAWIPGCATGQEAYSIGMMLRELLPPRVDLRIFATDVDQNAIDFARRGIYPADSLNQIPPQYHHYVRVTNNEIVIQPGLRDAILFSVHDLLRDPPLIKQDLVSCRNLLIYLISEGQDRAARSLAYSLNRDGFLFLGNSENFEEARYFRAIHAKEKIFRVLKRPSLEIVNESFRPISQSAIANEDRRPSGNRSHRIESSIERTLAETFAPPSILVTPNFTVTEVFGDLGPYLQLKNGLLQSTVESLFKRDVGLFLKSCIIQSKKLKTAKEYGTKVKLGEQLDATISVRVQPVEPEGLSPMFLVSFLKTVDAKASPSKRGSKRKVDEQSDRQLVNQLGAEVESLRDQLKDAIEDLESTNEELQSMNEELQSSNEELQSSNEELESTNEELRATNEELIVVNDQLRAKTNELDEFYSSLKLIEDTVDSAIVLIDNSLRAMRANHMAQRFLNVETNSLVSDLLERLRPREKASELGLFIRQRRHFSVALEIGERICQFSFLPITRSQSENQWGILVANDITELERSRQDTERNADRLAGLLDSLDGSVALLEKSGRISSVNRKWREFGMNNSIDPEYESIGKNYIEVCRKAARGGLSSAGELVQGLIQVLNGQSPKFALLYPCHSPTEQRWFLVVVTPMMSGDSIEGAVVAHWDVSERENWRRRYEEMLARHPEDPSS